MKYLIHRQFAKDFKKLPKNIQDQIKNYILEVGKSSQLEVINIKKISGFSDRYRLRIGDYRVGLTVEAEVVIFRRVLHRQNIYKKFP